MEKSDSIAKLAMALNKAQSEMSGAAKVSNNPFFNSKYADLSEVIKAIKEPFAINGLSYVQFPIEENGRIGVETILMHSSGEYLSNSFTVQLTKQDAQGAGSAITYCRRYGLQAVAGIPSEDDDGNVASPQAHSQPVIDDKPWYDEKDYQADLPGVTEAIRNGTPSSQVIEQIAQNYKVSNKYRDLIKSI